MARTSLTVQEVALAGITLSFEAANADGNSFANDGNVILYVKNGDASSHTVTIPTPATVGGMAVEDLTVSVPAGGEKVVGPFPTHVFNQSGGVVYVNYDAVTSVTVAAIKVR